MIIDGCVANLRRELRDVRELALRILDNLDRPDSTVSGSTVRRMNAAAVESARFAAQAAVLLEIKQMVDNASI